MAIKDDEKVIISLDKIPIRRALKRARKAFLLVLIILGFAAGTFYAKFIRTPSEPSVQIETKQE